MSIKTINGDLCHELLFNDADRKLAFDEKKAFGEWKTQVKEKLWELLGMERIERNVCSPNFEIEETLETETYTRIRFTFESERGAIVPCYLLIPKTGKEKYPVTILLQGHSTGFHNSIGVFKDGVTEEKLKNGSWALQAVERGFAALAIEQRAMGERRSPRTYGKANVFRGRPHMCAVQSLQAINLGRTVIGERVWDVSRAIDVLHEWALPVLDLDKIMVTGNSGGGTASFYAGGLEERIGYVAPCCSFCSYRTSIMNIEHCACNYIPSVCNWFEMEDLACLIAPRALTVIAGREDPIFPIDGVRESYETVKKIYEKAGAKDKCRLAETPDAHYWNVEIVWNAIVEETTKLGW